MFLTCLLRGLVVQLGMNVRLASERSRVQIPPSPFLHFERFAKIIILVKEHLLANEIKKKY